MICRLTTQRSAHLRGVSPEDSDRRDAGGTRPNLRNKTEPEGATTGLGQLSYKKSYWPLKEITGSSPERAFKFSVCRRQSH